MSVKTYYQKLKIHLKNGGLFYALGRGLKYLVFIARKEYEKFFPKRETAIGLGSIKIVFSDTKVNIFYDGYQVTKDYGLNAAINCSGNWVNSIDVKRKILKKTKNKIKFKINCESLKIDQIWTVAIEDNLNISWRIDLQIRNPIHIDEVCIMCVLDKGYKTWVNNFYQDDFPDFTERWNDLCLDSQPTSLIGARFPTKENFLPAFILESLDKRLLPVVRNSPRNDSQRLIGVRHTAFKEKDLSDKGVYSLFSGNISLFKRDNLLDAKIERLRKDYLDSVIKNLENKELERDLSVLLVNLPWRRHGRCGVRAGSRWPHIKDEGEGGYLPFPFFLAYAASLLGENGINAVLIDAIAEQISEEKFLEIILENNFDYLVVETSVPSLDDDLRLLEKISDYGISIILCGPNYEIFNPLFLQQHPFIDFVLFGEYEFSLLDFIQARRNNKDLSEVKGLIYKDNNKVIKTLPREPFDLDLLPWPRRENLPMAKYLDAPGDMRLPNVQMLASRGCPFKCQFCLWPQVIYQGCHYRARNVKDVINEMEYLVKQKGFRSVYFDDDTFNIGKQRMLNICNEIQKRGLNKTQWAIMARADLMDEELLCNFKKAGLFSVKYGVESSSQKLVDNIGKDMDLRKTEEMILLTKKLGIKVHLTFTFGLPGETKQTIKDTIDWVKNIDPFSAQFSILTPFPGTEYYEALDRQGLIISKDFSNYDGNSNSVFRLEGASSEDLEIARDAACRIWSDHVRIRRGLWGDLKRFASYCRHKGLFFTFSKAVKYLSYVFLKRKRYFEESKY